MMKSTLLLQILTNFERYIDRFMSGVIFTDIGSEGYTYSLITDLVVVNGYV